MIYDDLKIEAAGSFEFLVYVCQTAWHYIAEDRLIIVTGMRISNLTFCKLFSMYMKHSLEVYHIDFIKFLEDRNLVSTSDVYWTVHRCNS